jgi:hypothetical protein
MPQTRSLLATLVIIVRNGHYNQLFWRTEIGTVLANQRPVIGVCGMADLCSAGSNTVLLDKYC